MTDAPLEAPLSADSALQASWQQTSWPALAAECQAARERVALFDQSAYAKFIVEGPDSLAVLDELSTARIDVPMGKVVYTPWCNDLGGIEAALTVTRPGLDQFLVVDMPESHDQDLDCLKKAGSDSDVILSEITEHWACLELTGPKSRSVLAALTGASLSNISFPFNTSQRIEVAGFDVLALRTSSVGELGWQLYLPNEHAEELHEAIVAAGEPHGLALAGEQALEVLRLECGYARWGVDITADDTPIDAGLEFTVGWDKPNPWHGRAALEHQAAKPRQKALVQIRLDHPKLLCRRGDQILSDSEPAGTITSATWSYVEDRCLAMGYLHRRGAEGVNQEWFDVADFAVTVGSEQDDGADGEQISASVSLRSFYDPGNQRVHLAESP
ncbi:MAG: aminomethyltransferase family protein [Acidimicrobiaceae bacterium]|nr:aminomethyltransferase family protein [Acidimicrobiaceae bacterium]MCY4176481.1 aminomethyltransferase family protein [Acidimicrobiaceae bacterium]MCY4279778.1 aminomethyltransferase family protein [Acidimicrobiaceae bacterium]MCY4294506.1 aminomethyltransferase family protein [Acidimicrobiaceae bacterium]